MLKENNVVGLICIGLDNNCATLMLEGENGYTLPEITLEETGESNIVSAAYTLATQLSQKIVDIGLAYVVESKETTGYYFVAATEGNGEKVNNAKWALNADLKVDDEKYPNEFARDIEEHIKNGGWFMGKIKIIKE